MNETLVQTPEQFQRALELHQTGQLKQAQAIYEECELTQWNEALDSYERAISLLPDYEEAYFRRGTLLLHLRPLPAALASYDQTIALKTDYAEACSNRGNGWSSVLKRVKSDLIRQLKNTLPA